MMWETFNLVNRYRHGVPVDLYLTLGLTLVAMVCAALVPVGDPLRTLFILPFLLVLPGYALTAALFPNQIGLAERLLLTLALSISVTVVSGLLLNLTAWGLQGTTWIVWLGGITIAASMLALARRQRYLTPNSAVNPGCGVATECRSHSDCVGYLRLRACVSTRRRYTAINRVHSILVNAR